MATTIPTLMGTGGNQPSGEDAFATEGGTLVSDLSDIARALRAATKRTFQLQGVVLELQRDAVVNSGRDTDGRPLGYTTNMTAPNGDTLGNFEGLTLLVRFPENCAAGARFRINGVDDHFPLLSAHPSTEITADGVVAQRPYLISFQTGQGWLVIGSETPLQLAAILLGIPDGAFPGAKLADGSVDNAQLKDLSVGTDKIRDEAINRRTIGVGIITGNKIADGTIEASEIADGTLTAVKFATGVLPSVWTTEVITTTGSAVSHRISAKELEIEIWGGGGGGGYSFGAGSSGANSTLVYGVETIQVVGGLGGTGGTSGSPSPRAYPTPQTFPTIPGATTLEIQGAGAGGGVGGNLRDARSDVGSNGGAGSLVRVFGNYATATTIMLVFNLATGGAGNANASPGAPARALLRYR